MNTQAKDTNTQNTGIETSNTTTQTHYKKSVLELYTTAVTIVTTSKLSAQQISATGHEFKGLNNNILANAKAQAGYGSNIWFSENQIKEQGLTVVNDTEDYGVVLFSTYLKNIDESNKKETALRYWKVWNKDSLEVVPV